MLSNRVYHSVIYYCYPCNSGFGDVSTSVCVDWQATTRIQVMTRG